MKEKLIYRFSNDNLKKLYTRGSEYPNITIKLFTELINNEYYTDMSYGMVRDLERMCDQDINEIFPAR